MMYNFCAKISNPETRGENLMDDIEAKKALQDQVNNIARDIQYGMTFEEAGMDAEEFHSEPHDLISGHDYLADALEINYIVSAGCPVSGSAHTGSVWRP